MRADGAAFSRPYVDALFEVAGVDEQLAREAMTRAIHKLPLKARIIKREEGDA